MSENEQDKRLEETAGEERIAYLLMPNNDPSRQVLSTRK